MTKQDLGEMLGAYKDQIAFLKEELSESRKREEVLNAQVQRLQDGLMNVRAPEAYRDMRMDSRETTVSEASLEAAKTRDTHQKIQQRYINAMEGDIITSQQDLDDMMNSVLLKANKVGAVSLHGNSES
jgi:3-phenylpropionate/cinnamic acid dioxygenase small subunit